ncbi:MAG TPA: UPF0280 family protein [Syntrophothermus lipocalidus]|uniref:ApbE family lipoprotein n=1 Tax=Syntrophothermus lipocalidus (strain DSM 12680 / TGB-C1) TaxID=643648 RepID=D7CLD2_SYNLT|nr:UPF0280 family protein [Syntrophothermus lipocalidus]ADI01517.1 ApbE family lipoprotein [Syntrophothermus lipocalidus DSM 12680]HHV76898.1 UPF0280 family protein [Syntrophothermus lipocalidus]
MVQNDYSRRKYRIFYQASDLIYFQVKLKETDLAIGVDRESFNDGLVELAERTVIKLRGDLESYIILSPEFRTSFAPVPALPGAPPVAMSMIRAAAVAGVGPMAAVAGAIAEAVGKELESRVREVVVENGGDIYLSGKHDRIIGIFAGESPFSNRIGLKVGGAEMPVGVCTSSATVGPSVSLGRADAAVIKAKSAALADAVATGAGNLVQGESDLVKALEYAKGIDGVLGVIVIKKDKLAAWGEMEIIPLSKQANRR